MLLTCLLYVAVICVCSTYVGKSPRDVDIKTLSSPNCVKCSEAEFLKTEHSARDIRHSCECTKDKFAPRRRLIAEAIVELVEDELKVQNSESRDIDAFTEMSRDTLETNTNRIYSEKRLINHIVDKMLQTKKWPWQRAFDKTKHYADISKKAVAVVDNTDGLVDEFGPNSKAEDIKIDALSFKTDLIFSDETRGPFRGIFLSHFNTGFAEFGNHLGVGSVPHNLDKEPSPIHVLECSNVSSGSSFTSRSFCEKNLCSVRCEDGNQVQMHCHSNTVSVTTSSGQGKLSFQVTCGTIGDALD